MNDEPKELPCMATHSDGAHCGLTDWYEQIETGIQEALNRGPKNVWTTGWYASNKEIASAKITNLGKGTLQIEASVSDDFDTNGHGEKTIPFTKDLEKIRDAIFAAWTDAEGDQKDNAVYAGYKILKDGRWIETYIAQTSPDFWLDSPPGDNYHAWGWQGDSEIDQKIKDRLESWLQRHLNGETKQKQMTVKGFTIKPWND